MKNNDEQPTWKKLAVSISILFTTLIFCFLFGLMISYFSSVSYANSNHIKWENKICEINTRDKILIDELNKLGRDGWEVAGMEMEGCAFNTKYTVILKRQY